MTESLYQSEFASARCGYVLHICVPFNASVDVTDARCAEVKAIVGFRPPGCRAGPNCRPVKPGPRDGRELHPQPRFQKQERRIVDSSTASHPACILFAPMWHFESWSPRGIC